MNPEKLFEQLLGTFDKSLSTLRVAQLLFLLVFYSGQMKGVEELFLMSLYDLFEIIKSMPSYIPVWFVFTSVLIVLIIIPMALSKIEYFFYKNIHVKFTRNSPISNELEKLSKLSALEAQKALESGKYSFDRREVVKRDAIYIRRCLEFFVTVLIAVYLSGSIITLLFLIVLFLIVLFFSTQHMWLNNLSCVAPINILTQLLRTKVL